MRSLAKPPPQGSGEDAEERRSESLTRGIDSAVCPPRPRGGHDRREAMRET